MLSSSWISFHELPGSKSEIRKKHSYDVLYYYVISSSWEMGKKSRKNKGGGGGGGGGDAKGAVAVEAWVRIQNIHGVLVPIEDWMEAPEALNVYGSEKFVIGPL